MDLKIIFMIIRYVLVAIGAFVVYREQATIDDFVLQSVYSCGAGAFLLVCALLGTPVIGKSKEHDANDHFKYLIATVIVVVAAIVLAIIF